MKTTTVPRAPHRVARVQGLRRSSAAGLHRPAKSGRCTVRRAVVADALSEYEQDRDER